ncbi:hypothetical protein [Photorhabdus stackebrandtii]|uniref:hypothetical protein n=1 Tax=Photorhabdus stackebrandtii TaxID=1123042 RepID=UPI001F60753F|nr:hypothetical protein [Photorhabdus stackebrandtii]
MNKESSLPNSFAISVFLAVLAACLNLILWRADILEMAHNTALKGLIIVWYILGWGFAPGCLTALTINSIRTRLSQMVGAVVAMLISFLLVTGICGLVYAYLTNPAFMQIAMGGEVQSSFPGKPGNYSWFYCAATTQFMCDRYLDSKCFFGENGSSYEPASKA